MITSVRPFQLGLQHGLGTDWRPWCVLGLGRRVSGTAVTMEPGTGLPVLLGLFTVRRPRSSYVTCYTLQTGRPGPGPPF